MIASPLSDECNEVETFGFGDNSYVTDENTEIVACETYMTDVDAYSGTTSGLVTERAQSWGGVRHLLSEFPVGRGFFGLDGLFSVQLKTGTIKFDFLFAQRVFHKPLCRNRTKNENGCQDSQSYRGGII